MRLVSRSLLWMAPALMLAAGCGGTTEPDACENVTCGDNASCSAGACVCASGFEGDAKAGCTAVVACTDTSCSGHGTCDASSGAVVCSCEEGYTGATCLNCATGFERVDGACVAADACADLECGDHGSCVVDGDASCECDEGYTGPACNLCDAGFKAQGELCVPKTACDSMECTDNATCVEDQGVASCQCDAGFASEGDECLKEKFVDCTDSSPDDATADTDDKVKVTWDAVAEAWSTPADCPWSCDRDFFETEEGACINTRRELCDDSGAEELPEGVEFVSGVEVDVSFTTDGQWAAPEACQTRCKANYTLDGEACINSRLTDCINPEVANADPVLGVKVPQTWADGNWSTPAFCAYTCQNEFNDLFGDGRCLDTAEVDCTQDGTKPDGSEWVEGKKTITYTSTGGWTSRTCDFICAAGTGPTEAGDCDDEQWVACDRSNAPVNAHPVEDDVLVTWDVDEGAWTAPARCEFECNVGYDQYEGAGECANRLEVDCNPDEMPLNSEIVGSGKTFIDFVEGNWTEPAACSWVCQNGYRDDEGACVENAIIVDCRLYTSPEYPVLVGEEATLQATVRVEGAVSQAPTSDFDGKLCYTGSSIAVPVDPSALLCVDAAFDGDEVVAAELVVSLPGVYNYVFVLSGDGGSTWTACDQVGRVEDTVTPGTVRFALSTADQIANVRTATGSELPLPVDGATVTYVREAVGNDDAGFFVQADKDGPALFVKYADTGDVMAGAVVSFTVTSVTTATGGALAATIDAVALVDFADHEALVQKLTTATDVVSGLDDYESELVSLTGVIAGPFVSAGTDHVAAPLHTADLQSDSLELRLPQALVDELFLDEGCTVTVTGPMWRYGDKAQPSAYVADDLVVVCEGLKVTGVEVPDNTTVVITFNRAIDTAAVLDLDDHLYIDSDLELVLEDMEIEGNTLTVTTSVQVEDRAYSLEVYFLTDHAGRELEVDPTIVNFVGVAAPPVCGWDGTGPAVVISQVYGGGGNSGATYKHDFVELFNRSDAIVTVAGWSLQYGAADKSAWSSLAPLSGTIAPGAFYLVRLGTGNGNSTAPEITGFDASGNQNISGSNGKVALVSATAVLPSGTCPVGSVVDWVGFGSANCNNGTTAAPGTSDNTKSIHRTDVCVDSNQDGTDFSNAAVTPRSGKQ